MPIQTIKFRPGINVQYTETLNEGGWSDSNLVRFLDGLPQCIGGWEKYWPFSLGVAIRAVWDWQDLNAVKHLALGATNELGVITSGVLADITPQIMTSDFVPDIETTSASATVSVTDTNISNVTTYDTVFFNTPVSVGGIILEGAYPIALVTGTTSYNITAGSNATATIATITITGATQANPCSITAVSHGRSTGDYVFIAGVGGMTQLNGRIFQITSTGANSFTLDGVDSSAYGVYTTGGFVYGGIVPQFAATSGSALVDVILPDHGLAAAGRITFPIDTEVGGVTIGGTYTVVSVADADTFTITADQQADTTETVIMNDGEVQIEYYIAQGPPAIGVGYGLGTYGTGVYGLGVVPTAQSGDPITVTDWTLDNWGQTLIACAKDGGIYAWDPDGGFETGLLVSGQDAPLFSTGAFIAQPAQILVAYGTTTLQTDATIGVYQDPLLVRWSDQDDYTNWSIDTTNQVGSVRLPRGSRIIGGIQGPTRALLWTDSSVWSMRYVGPPLVFTFDEISSGCGLIAQHAQAVLGNTVYWMSASNFWMMSGNGAPVEVPCSLWDAVFQDLDTDNQHKCWAMPLQAFSEIWFFYPSSQDGTGECSRYVKVQIDGTQATWDKGILARSAGVDASVLDYPIMCTSAGLVYQHESGFSADGSSINAYVESGYVMISDGTYCMFVSQIRPDMKYGFVGQSENASMTVTTTAVNDVTGEEMSSVDAYTTATLYKTPRVRGHRVKLKIESNQNNAWWRLGAMRYMANPDGRV